MVKALLLADNPAAYMNKNVLSCAIVLIKLKLIGLLACFS